MAVQPSDNTLALGTGTPLPKVAAPVTPAVPPVPAVAPTTQYTTGASNTPTPAASTQQTNATGVPAAAPQTPSNQPVMDPLAFSTTPAGNQVNANVAGTGGATMPSPAAYSYPTNNVQGGSFYNSASSGTPPSDDDLYWDDIQGTYRIKGTGEAYTGSATQNAGYVAPPAATTPQNLDDWWAQHGSGPRYSMVNGTVVDMAMMSLQGIQGAQQRGDANTIGAYGSALSPEIAKSLQDAIDAANAANVYGQTHGGFSPPGYGGVGTGSPNDQPLYQNPNVPDAPFTDANGTPATQGGYAPGSPLYTGGGTEVGAPPGYADAPIDQPYVPPDGWASATPDNPYVPPEHTPYDPSGLTPNDTNPGGQLPWEGGSTLPVTTVPGGGYEPPTQTTGGGSTNTNPSGDGTTTVPGGGPNTPTSPDLNPGIKPLDPAKDLRNFEITPGDMVDRFKLATQQFGTFNDSTSSAYQAALRDANRAAAATGRLGSGMLRTSYGDLANQRANALTTERDSLFQNALLGSVQDAQQKYNDYLAEQAFEQGAQNTAFQQQIQGMTLQDQLTQSAFNRAFQQGTFGGADSPSDMQALMAQLTGGSASSALQALSQLIASQNAANAAAKGASGSTGSTGTDFAQQLIDLFKRLGTGASGVDSPVGGDYGNTAVA